jgi:glyoxylase-like metal-dependent hydrolase (beta-lactamase superfamily II)
MTEHSRITVDCDVTDHFTAAYLRLAGSECAFIEAHTSHAVPKLLAAVRAAGKAPEAVRWVVVTHAHLDHAAGAGALLQACPNATLLAHPRAARHLIDPSKLVASATSVYGAKRFAELYGTIDPIPAARVRALEDGATFELGDATLQVLHTAGHANHHFVVHDPRLDCVYTGDSFGLVYPAIQGRGRFAIASTSPTNFDALEARKSLKRILDLKTTFACLTHFDAFADVAEIGAQVGAWVDRAEAWVDEAASGSESVEAMTTRLAEQWKAAVAAESERRGLGFSDQAFRLLALDLELNAQGLAFVAAARRGAVKS